MDIDLGTFPWVSAHVRDFSMITSGLGTSTGLTLQSETTTTGSPYTVGISDLTNLDFFGASGYAQGDFFSDAIVLNGMSNVSLQNVNIYGAGGGCTSSISSTCGIGILASENSVTGTLANVINVAASNFYYLSSGIDGVGDVESLTVQQSSFLGNSIGILASGSGLALQWNIGPSNNFTDVFQDINATNAVNGLTVNNNLFLVTKASEIGIDIAAPPTNPNGSAILQGNYIGCSHGVSGTEGIYLGGYQTSPSVVNGNIITDCGTAILTDAHSTLINIGNNVFNGNTPPTIINNGTLNVIANNLGYNPVGTGADLLCPWALDLHGRRLRRKPII